MASDTQIDLEMGINGPGGCLCAGANCYLSAFLEMSQLQTDDILVFRINEEVSCLLDFSYMTNLYSIVLVNSSPDML